MNDTELKNDKNAFKELLLAEYDYLTKSFLWNESLGEKRISFFITLVTAGLTILLALTSQETLPIDPQSAPILFAAGVLVLLLFGLITFKRIIKRNIDTDKKKDQLDRLRQYFVTPESEEIKYLPFDPYSTEPKRDPLRILSLGTGGLLQTIALINCIIIAISIIWLLRWITLSPISLVNTVMLGVLGLTGFMISWIGQVVYAQIQYGQRKIKKYNEGKKR